MPSLLVREKYSNDADGVLTVSFAEKQRFAAAIASTPLCYLKKAQNHQRSGDRPGSASLL
jgi:hypothetical protein